MKEARVNPGPTVIIRDIDFPQLPSESHLIIKVIVAGSNPKDWAIAERYPGSTQGDDIAGLIHSVGRDVANFKPGDRVAAFHEMLTPYGAFGEYAIAPETTTFHLPPSVSFEEAATIPLTGMTAAVGLYQRLGLPLPWFPAQERLPLVVYGAASAVGAFAVKLAMLSNIHPTICVAGRGSSFVETLIDRSRGDTIIDYRQCDEKINKELRHALGPAKLQFAFDAVSDKGSFQNLTKVMDHHEGKITLVLPRKQYEGDPADTIKRSFTQVGTVHSDRHSGRSGKEKILEGRLGDVTFGQLMFKFFERGLFEGWFKGHPYKVVPGGLEGVQTGLTDLKAGKASAVKYVFRVDETPWSLLAKI